MGICFFIIVIYILKKSYIEKWINFFQKFFNYFFSQYLYEYEFISRDCQKIQQKILKTRLCLLKINKTENYSKPTGAKKVYKVQKIRQSKTK